MPSPRSNLALPAVALLAVVLLLEVSSLVLPLSLIYSYEDDGIHFSDNYMFDDPKGVIVSIGIVVTAWLAVVVSRGGNAWVRRLIWPFGVLSCLPVAVAFGVVQGDIEIGGVAVVLEALLRVATVPLLVLLSRRDADVTRHDHRAAP
ncbi:hypothetical protein AB0425_12905 [Actinosynnema sp. NPDC051121]